MAGRKFLITIRTPIIEGLYRLIRGGFEISYGSTKDFFSVQLIYRDRHVISVRKASKDEILLS